VVSKFKKGIEKRKQMRKGDRKGGRKMEPNYIFNK
jgi:hypothetical protein